VQKLSIRLSLLCAFLQVTVPAYFCDWTLKSVYEKSYHLLRHIVVWHRSIQRPKLHVPAVHKRAAHLPMKMQEQDAEKKRRRILSNLSNATHFKWT